MNAQTKNEIRMIPPYLSSYIPKLIRLNQVKRITDTFRSKLIGLMAFFFCREPDESRKSSLLNCKKLDG